MKKICYFLSILLAFTKIGAMEHGSSAFYAVGELGPAWQFPSDHLPVGFSVGNVHGALWNTLNTRYIYHIHANHQGLKDSLITTANVSKEPHSRLTIREEMIVDLVMDMVYHAPVPRSLLALQEVGEEVYHELRRRLPDRMLIAAASPEDLSNRDIFIYDSSRFAFISLLADCYRIRPRNNYLTLTLREKQTEKVYCFIQSHVPGGPVASTPARKEWAENILLHFNPEAVTVVMGDMNRSPDFFLRDLKAAAEDCGLEDPLFQNLWVPYPTHIDTYKQAVWIDNVFVYEPEGGAAAQVERYPANLGPAVEKMVSLLRGFNSRPLKSAFELWCQLTAHKFTVLQDSYGHWTEALLKCALAESAYIHCDLSLLSDDKDWEIYPCIVLYLLDVIEHPEQLGHAIDVIKLLRAQEKSVILVMPPYSFAIPEVRGAISAELGFHASNCITQRYLTEDEEERLLGDCGLSREEKEQYKSLVQGMSFAYLAPLSGIESYEHLHQEARQQIAHVWAEIRCQRRFDVQTLLTEIARELLTVEELLGTDELRRLVDTGLIGNRDGAWVMPQMVRDFILESWSK